MESINNQGRLKRLSTVGWQNRRATQNLSNPNRPARFVVCTGLCVNQFSTSTPERTQSPPSGFLLLHLNRHETVEGGSEGCLSAFSPTQPEVKDSICG